MLFFASLHAVVAENVGTLGIFTRSFFLKLSIEKPIMLNLICLKYPIYINDGRLAPWEDLAIYLVKHAQCQKSVTQSCCDSMLHKYCKMEVC